MQDSQPVSSQDRTNLLLLLLFGFFVVFNISAVIIQNLSGEAPNAHGTIVDMFTGSILWMASMVALLTAVMRYPDTKRLILWLAVSAGAGAFAIDEMFEIHEQTVYLLGEDDYIKIVMLLVAVTGLILLYQMEKPSRKVIQFFGMGFLLPISIDTLYWVEEAFEMLAVQTYFAGLMVFYMTQAHLVAETDAPAVRNQSKESPQVDKAKLQPDIAGA